MPRPSGRAEQNVEVEGRKNPSVARKFRGEDAESVMAIAAESPEASNWSRDSYIKFADEENTLSLVIETEGGEVSGFLVGRGIADQAEVLNLAVGKRHRRCGEGAVLLETFLKECERHCAKNVYLEVRESNTDAIAFYEKHGFSRTGKRKGYYRYPDEAAVSMEKKLTGPPG